MSHGSSGSFGDVAHDRSVQLVLATHRPALVGALAISAAASLVAQLLRRSSLGD